MVGDAVRHFALARFGGCVLCNEEESQIPVARIAREQVGAARRVPADLGSGPDQSERGAARNLAGLGASRAG